MLFKSKSEGGGERGHLLEHGHLLEFLQYILNSFKVIERTRLCQETAKKVQRDVTQKVSIQELWFLHSAREVSWRYLELF